MFFLNDMTSLDSAEELLVMLIRFGYLVYDARAEEAFIPNEDARCAIALALSGDGI